MQYEISRSETIPFLDSNGCTMQMKQYEVVVSLKTDPGETLEELEKQMEVTFEKHRQIIAEKIPLLETGKKRLNFLSEKLKGLVSENDFKAIIDQTKAIK